MEDVDIPLLNFDATPENRGTYVCQARNNLASVTSDSAFITIDGKAGVWYDDSKELHEISYVGYSL